MPKRAGVLGPFQLVEMGVDDEFLNRPEFLEALPKLDSRSLTYACMIQAGLDRLDIVSAFEADLPKPKNLRDRVRFNETPHWPQAFTLVHGLFAQYIPEYEPNKREFMELGRLFRFIVDLLFALAERKALVRVSPLPDLSLVAHQLPPELFIPIRNLFSSFEQISASSPVPSSAVTEESVARFQEVISSSLFHEYVQAHDSLDDASASTPGIADAVSVSAKALCDRYRRYLRRKRLATAILPISAQLVETILGELPGDVAKQATSSAESWLASNRRLVIYQLDSTVAELIHSRVEAFARATTKSET